MHANCIVVNDVTPLRPHSHRVGMISHFNCPQSSRPECIASSVVLASDPTAVSVVAGVYVLRLGCCFPCRDG